MSVSCYFGLTESGKSFHVKNHVLPSWSKKVIFDLAHCFDGEIILMNPTDSKILETCKKLAGADRFSVVVRPSRSSSDEALFNKSVHLACALGRLQGKTSPRVQFVCDEADFICSPHYQSKELKHLVNKGRHDNVDAHFIARMPNRLHTDIRANCSKIVTFYLNNAGGVPLFTENFREKIPEIKDLPKYWRFEWSNNGEMAFFDEKNQKHQKIPRKKDEKWSN